MASSSGGRMTHKLPQGIDAGLREALERIEAMIQAEGSTWDLSSNDKRALQIVLKAAAPPDPRKDLAALTGEQVRHIVYVASGFDPRYIRDDTWNRIAEQIMAEMRGAKR